MKRFLQRALLFAVPFAVYIAVVLVVDPYDRFARFDFAPDSVKKVVARPANYALWTVSDLDRHPTPNVLLGDSKMQRLNVDEIRRVSGLSFLNLGMEGASSSDIIDLFWRAADRVHLQYVVIGLNVDNLNRHTNRDMVKAAETAQSRPLLYFSSRDVLGATAKLIAARIRGRSLAPDKATMTHEEMWQYGISYAATRKYQDFAFDDDALTQYSRIAAYCRQHGIRLRFIVLPTQTDVHEKIREFGLEAAWKALPDRLRGLAETTNYDTANEITADRARFEDPFHMKLETATQVVDEVFARQVP